jgi:hypothetical protein
VDIELETLHEAINDNNAAAVVERRRSAFVGTREPLHRATARTAELRLRDAYRGR